MDDLNDKIARVLSDPNSMAKIQGMMAALSGGDTPAAPSEPSPPPPPSEPSPNLPFDGLPDLSMLSKLAPLMGAFSKEDDDTRLLQALRPYLHGERERRLDDTVKMLRLTKLLYDTLLDLPDSERLELLYYLNRPLYLTGDQKEISIMYDPEFTVTEVPE